MSEIWDGNERRQEEKERARKLDRIIQQIDETVLPLVKKHDTCLYGKDGTEGINKAIQTLAAVADNFIEHKKSHLVLPGILLGIFTLAVAFLEFLHRTPIK